MKLTPLHSEFGISIQNLSVDMPLNEPEWNQVRRAMEEHSVVLIPNQSLNDDSQFAFTKRIGIPEEEHVSYYSRGEISYIGTVGNIDSDGNQQKNKSRSVRSGTGNQMWHSDSSFREIPCSFSLLYAHEIPAEGGDTEFVSTRAAYTRLDETTKSLINSEVGIHDYIYSRTKISEDAVTQGQRTFMYPVRQKLVRTNPVTGDSNFYIGSHVRDIEGWEKEKSQRLLERLMTEATREASIYRHKWNVGDLLIWDNRCVLHRGCGYDADKYRRLLRQTRVRGIGPTLAEDGYS